MTLSNPQAFDKQLNFAASSFNVKVFKSPLPKSTFFLAAGHYDEQSGGWLIEELERNLAHCITEKTGKIQIYKARYPEWWLVLDDRIGYGIDEFDQQSFRKTVTVQPGDFDKIILLNPHSHARAFQVYP